MKRIGLGAIIALGCIAGFSAMAPVATAQTTAPPGDPYKQVCKLVQLPCFLPGMGDLYVNPSTIPAGPWLGYDKKGNLVNTMYMIPIKDIDQHKNFDDLKVAKDKSVDHVSIILNPGHPGVPEVHYHIILWYISPQEVDALK